MPELTEDPAEPEVNEAEEYQQSLSPSAREEFSRVLAGGVDPVTGTEEPGCLETSLSGADPDAPYERFADLLEEIRGASDLADQDPEVLAAWEAYRECLSSAGFPGVRTDPWELLDQRFTQEFPDDRMLEDDPRLPELVAWEVSLANAHLDCLEETRLEALRARATARGESEILARRAAEVDAYLAAAREWYGID